VSITIWLVVSTVAVALSPALLLVAELVAALTRDRRVAMLTRMILAYLAHELFTLLACGAAWLLAGAGRLMSSGPIQALHWRLLGWYVGGIAGSVLRTLGIQVVQEAGSEDADGALRASNPLLVLSRHAGPADTILLIDQLMARFSRRPSVVFKEALVLDPAIDLLANRLPHAVLDTEDPQQCEARITETVSGLGSRGLLLLFPEGGNFTPERRRNALRSLRRHGRRTEAGAAERMHHVLPPRPTGALAALAANRSADVVFAAHTGLGLAAYPRAIWRNLPVGRTLRTRLWLVPRSEVPTAEHEIVAWLNDWWLTIDGWIDGHAEQDERDIHA
jgi:1-acyl-sn-glycerol-3-phosphate acyltransferase